MTQEERLAKTWYAKILQDLLIDIYNRNIKYLIGRNNTTPTDFVEKIYNPQEVQEALAALGKRVPQVYLAPHNNYKSNMKSIKETIKLDIISDVPISLNPDVSPNEIYQAIRYYTRGLSKSLLVANDINLLMDDLHAYIKNIASPTLEIQGHVSDPKVLAHLILHPHKYAPKSTYNYNRSGYCTAFLYKSGGDSAADAKGVISGALLQSGTKVSLGLEELFCGFSPNTDTKNFRVAASILGPQELRELSNRMEEYQAIIPKADFKGIAKALGSSSVTLVTLVIEAMIHHTPEISLLADCIPSLKDNDWFQAVLSLGLQKGPEPLVELAEWMRTSHKILDKS